MARYSSRFIAHFASILRPLRRLIQKSTTFHFGPEQKQVFRVWKRKQAEAGNLAYFDNTAPTKVIANAEPFSTGGILVQEQQREMVLLCYVSRCHNDCECRYSQNEKEALVLARKRLHLYKYGKKV